MTDVNWILPVIFVIGLVAIIASYLQYKKDPTYKTSMALILLLFILCPPVGIILFVMRVVRDFKEGKNDAEREWDSRQQLWKDRFQELATYKQENGDCSVPSGREENKELRLWLSNQRNRRKKGQLEAERIKQLDELGFVWDQTVQVWEDRFQELIGYKQEHGNCLVPTNWQENKKLGKWISHQRNFSKKGKLDADKIKRLDELGFVWDTRK